MTILDLKLEAHQLIADIQSYGVPKNKIYGELASRLGLSMKETHVANVCTMQQGIDFVRALTAMKSRQETKWRKKTGYLSESEQRRKRHLEKMATDKLAKCERKRKNTLSQAEMKRAVAEVASINEQNEFYRKHPLLSRLKELYHSLLTP